MNSLSNYFDKWFCGENQLPASLFSFITDSKNITIHLVNYRLGIFFCILFELSGSFLTTYGLFSGKHVAFLITGILFKSLGGLLSSYFQNNCGILQSIEIEKQIKHVKYHANEAYALLSDKGCSETEIRALNHLPSEIYQGELQNYRRNRLINFLTPISCSLALLLHGEILLSIGITILGLASFPLGELFFKQHAFRHESEFRLAKSAQLFGYLQKIYKDHIKLTLKVNLLSQLPLLLFGLRVLFNSSGELLAAFYGITQGLVGLSETLASQRSRVFSQRSTLTAKRFFEVLINPLFIITPSRWNEHISKNANVPLSSDLSSGVFLDNFQVRNLHEPITCHIPKGNVCHLIADSGKGKSTFLSGLMHYIEHKGDFYFIEENIWKNIHQYPKKSLETLICYIKEENIDPSSRLIDLFKDLLNQNLKSLYIHTEKNFGKTLAELSFNAPDNLIEHEIDSLLMGKKAVFPFTMLNDLKLIREEKSKILQEFLKTAKGNLSSSSINPIRVFGTLSSGEKKRLLTLYACEFVKRTPDCKLLILDEPLANLDETSIEHQLSIIKSIHDLPNPPAILLISHIMTEKIQNNLVCTKPVILQ